MSIWNELLSADKPKEQDKFEKALEKLKQLEEQENLKNGDNHDDELEAGMDTLTIPGKSLF